MSTPIDYPGVEPPPPGRTVNMAEPDDVLATYNMVTNILCTLVMTPFVLTRVYAKWRVLPPFNLADWCCVVSYLLSLGHITTAFGMGAGGGGYNIWEVTPAEYMTFNKYMYADTIIFGYQHRHLLRHLRPNSWFLKVTLLLAITQVFNVNRTFVVSTYCFIAAMAAYYLPVMVIKILICRPIAAYWDPSVDGACWNNRPIFVADTTLSVLTDLVVLITPIPLILKLHMRRTTKLQVYLLLSAGGVATVASFVRMVLVVGMQKSSNPTVDFIRFNMPCTAEVTIGLCCACLPAINKLYTYWARKEPLPDSHSPQHVSPHFATSTPRFLQRARSSPRFHHVNGTDTIDLIAGSDGGHKALRATSPTPPEPGILPPLPGIHAGGIRAKTITLCRSKP